VIGATIKGASTVTVCARQVAGVPARLDRRANPLAGEPDEAQDLVTATGTLDAPARADESSRRQPDPAHHRHDPHAVLPEDQG